MKKIKLQQLKVQSFKIQDDASPQVQQQVRGGSPVTFPTCVNQCEDTSYNPFPTVPPYCQ
jgi:hypothetical protein